MRVATHGGLGGTVCRTNARNIIAAMMHIMDAISSTVQPVAVLLELMRELRLGGFQKLRCLDGAERLGRTQVQ